MTPETALRQTIPVFVNSFNQRCFLKDTVDWFATNGFKNVTVLDHESGAAGLLEYFQSDDFNNHARLHQLGANLGPRAAVLQAQQLIGPNAPFIFTDPDLWLPPHPDPEFISKIFAIGSKYGCLKVGLALDISQPELFQPSLRDEIVTWEERFWRRKFDTHIYGAAVDTTFFVHVPSARAPKRLWDFGRKQAKVPALRLSGDGFLAKHRPWYTDDGQPDAERQQYLSTATRMATWAKANQAHKGTTEPPATDTKQTP